MSQTFTFLLSLLSYRVSGSPPSPHQWHNHRSGRSRLGLQKLLRNRNHKNHQSHQKSKSPYPPPPQLPLLHLNSSIHLSHRVYHMHAPAHAPKKPKTKKLFQKDPKSPHYILQPSGSRISAAPSFYNGPPIIGKPGVRIFSTGRLG